MKIYSGPSGRQAFLIINKSFFVNYLFGRFFVYYTKIWKARRNRKMCWVLYYIFHNKNIFLQKNLAETGANTEYSFELESNF